MNGGGAGSGPLSLCPRGQNAAGHPGAGCGGVCRFFCTGRPGQWRTEAMLLISAVAIVAFATCSRAPQCFRYVLPVMPFVCTGRARPPCCLSTKDAKDTKLARCRQRASEYKAWEGWWWRGASPGRSAAVYGFIPTAFLTSTSLPGVRSAATAISLTAASTGGRIYST